VYRSGVLADLKFLARGKGVHAANLAERLGPNLRAVLGVPTEESSPAVRARVMTGLGDAVTHLPGTVQASVAAGLGLAPEAQKWFLGDRLSWVADAEGYSVKTIRRRYLEGLELLADVLMAPGPAGPESESVDFWCPSASLELVSEPPRIELIETRTVVAELAGLRSAPVAWSSEADRAKASDQLRVYCLHGGLVSRESPSSTGGLWRGRVYFPRPLASGERHEFRTRLVDPQHQQRFLIVTAQRRIDHLLVRVKFVPHAWPVAPIVERVEGIPAQFVEDPGVPGVRVPVDDVGEVVAEFHRVRSGFSYGLRWRSAQEA